MSDMLLTDYKFGGLVIDGKKYQSDLVIFNNAIIEEHWWRKEGHLLQLVDIEPFIQPGTEVILVGRGFSSNLKISSQLQIYLLERGIVLQGLSSKEAVERYNELKHEHLLALFHLTC